MTPQPAPPSDPSGGGAGAPANRKVVLSVGFGLLAFACTFFEPFGGFLLAIPAVTTAIHGRREIRESHGGEGGDLLGVAGLTMGITTIVLVALSWLISPVLG